SAIQEFAVINHRVHRKREAQVGLHVVLARGALGLAVLVIGLPPPVTAEAALDAGHAAHGLGFLLGPLLNLGIPDLSQSSVAAARCRSEQRVQAWAAASRAGIAEGTLHLI